MKKILGLLATVSLVTTTSAGVISCGDSKEKDTPSTNTKKNLSELSVKQLGEWKGVGDSPTNDEIVKQINEKNKDYNLTSSDVDITTSSLNDLKKGAKLTAKSTSTKFTGSVEVTYTYSKSESAPAPEIQDIADINGYVGENSSTVQLFNLQYKTTVTVKNFKKDTKISTTSSNEEVILVDSYRYTDNGTGVFELNFYPKDWRNPKSGTSKITFKYGNYSSKEFNVNISDKKRTELSIKSDFMDYDGTDIDLNNTDSMPSKEQIYKTIATVNQSVKISENETKKFDEIFKIDDLDFYIKSYNYDDEEEKFIMNVLPLTKLNNQYTFKYFENSAMLRILNPKKNGRKCFNL
ncbi:hypothetical protein SLITO_v1c07060 [Spiroplasma litorale]|uniref:Lipoprotein n=1 Tax=Spiroplasma litorale TaxID=216942 RepID=A0A0K1W2D3_9MOLU|nr:lipoprotein [Spiroplasma litorale]AKX34331.1 hypothetical protein SLITO_v1c07060 [Spiroplasma litorale]